MEKIVALAKRRGFIYPGSEIYGGLTGTWDYGPLGVLLKQNIKSEWWRSIVQLRDDVVGIDASIMMNPEVWRASGHVEAFTDPLVECMNCHSRFRVDHLVKNPKKLEQFQEKIMDFIEEGINQDKLEFSKIENYLKTIDYLQQSNSNDKDRVIKQITDEADKTRDEIKKRIKTREKFLIETVGESFKNYGPLIQYYLNTSERCPDCGHSFWTKPKKFNLLVKAYLGVVEGEQSEVFLRGEITQGAFVNFENVVSSTRVKIPFGIAQIGKAFRNEITPGNFTYRSREFEQMELEFFIRPDESEGNKWFDYWKNERLNWYKSLGLNPDKLRFRKHEDTERAHYAKSAEDIEYETPFGWSEFEGIHNRGDWDLSRHKLGYIDETGAKFTPWVIEASGGVDRSALSFLIDSYSEIGDRVILKLHPKLAPYKVAVFPLLGNKPELIDKAKSIYESLKPHFMTAWDDRGNIGKRYLSQDEAGTPWCVTVDFETLENDSVTIRDRDTAKQERVKISEIAAYISKKLK